LNGRSHPREFATLRNDVLSTFEGDFEDWHRCSENAVSDSGTFNVGKVWHLSINMFSHYVTSQMNFEYGPK